MNNLNTSNTFVFNAEIDANYLTSLYGDDFVYLQEVFETVLVDYQSLTDNIEYSYSSGNLSALRSAVHKIKPVFGFVGLTAVQLQCQHFEQICGTVTSPDHLSGDFETLKNKIFHSRQLIEEEKKKLEIFNSNCS
jgi:HPt (histidine-containing phosphotransfer) domain-containing protein